jgi:hypothetical protein
MFDGDLCVGMVLAALLLAGCAADTDTPAEMPLVEQGESVRLVRWVGVIEETDVKVAAVLGKGRGRLYFCGGATSYLTTTRWLDLQFTDEHLEYADDTWRIHAHLTAGGVLGELERAGDSLRIFNAQPFERATIAGLYEGKAACGRLGLIVSQATAKDEPTAQGACVGNAGEPAIQVFPIMPIALVKGTVAVRTPGSTDGISRLQAATLEPL